MTNLESKFEEIHRNLARIRLENDLLNVRLAMLKARMSKESASTPTVVSRSDLSRALAPLFSLLGVDGDGVVSSIPLIIGRDRISFALASEAAQSRSMRDEVPPLAIAVGDSVDASEWARFVEVRISGEAAR